VAGTGQSRSRQHRRRLDEAGRTGRVPARWSPVSIPNSDGSNRRRPARPWKASGDDRRDASGAVVGEMGGDSLRNGLG
jgi:hypothetical protein